MGTIADKFRYMLGTKELMRKVLGVGKEVPFRKYPEIMTLNMDDSAINKAYVEQQDLMSDIRGIGDYRECTKEEVEHVEKLLKNMTEGV